MEIVYVGTRQVFYRIIYMMVFFIVEMHTGFRECRVRIRSRSN